MIGEQTATCPEAPPRLEATLAAQLDTPLTLLAQAVGTALRGRGVRIEDSRDRSRRGTGGAPATLVVIDDLVAADDVRRVLAVVRSAAGRVLVLTARERGPWWGAIVAAGAHSILPSAVSIDELVCALATLDADGELLSSVEQEELVQLWDGFVRQQCEVALRLARLTPKEHDVLDGMRDGDTVAELATRLAVREATVRSHVRSILRKLGVRSQLAAVAVVRGLDSPLVVGAEVLTRTPVAGSSPGGRLG